MKLLLVLTALTLPEVHARLPYVVGGQDATPGKWPWQVSLQNAYRSHYCGASIISAEWVLTAAHCVEGRASSVRVVVGLHDQRRRKGNPKTIRVSKIIRHRDYVENGRQGYPNDIALLSLSSPIDLSDQYASAVELPSSGENFVGDECWITGWGKTSRWSRSPNTLQEAQVDVYTKEQCADKYGPAISAYHTCVGKAGKSGACMGDSGGPLVCKVDSSWKLAGVTSWGRSDCNVNYPSVYANVSYFRDWIRQNANI